MLADPPPGTQDLGPGSSVDFIQPRDSLLRDPDLPYHLELPVLGITTRFETNSRYVFELITETFGGWRNLPPDAWSADSLNVRVVVRDGTESVTGHAPVKYFCPDPDRVVLHSPGSVAVSDPAKRESIAYVTTELASDRAHFRLTVLEAITLALISHFDRHPIHAAAIAGHGRAVLLAAPSGTGKSTLAYAAHVAGFDVLGDDHVWVQLTPTLRIWGWPGRILLLPEVASIFPEIAGLRSASENGKRKLAFNLAAAPNASRYIADPVAVCILDREPTRPRLERLTPEAVAEGLANHLTPGFDRFPARHNTTVAALASSGGWRLTLSNDPREALPLIREMLREP